jgi:uncharacterized protein CbrC (UPF0167 family)
VLSRKETLGESQLLLFLWTDPKNHSSGVSTIIDAKCQALDDLLIVSFNSPYNLMREVKKRTPTYQAWRHTALVVWN